MELLNMRKEILIVAAGLAWAPFTWGAGAPATRPATTEPSTKGVDPIVAAFLTRIESAAGDDDLRRKLIERHNTAVRLLDLRIAGYRHGLSEGSAVFEATALVADAKMDLARNPQEREAVARQVVDVTRLGESTLERQFRAGFGSEANVVRARLARESAEAELLKLQRSGAAPTTQPR
jgi:hypothetical protein